MGRRGGLFGGLIITSLCLTIPLACAPADRDPRGEPVVAGSRAGSEPGTGKAERPRVSWTTKLDAVSHPKAAGGVFVAYVADEGKLALAGFDPNTGREIWRRRSSASSVTPGVTIEVATDGRWVFHFSPEGPQRFAVFEAIDAASGRGAWRSDRLARFSEPVDFCDDGKDKRRVCSIQSDSGRQWAFDTATGTRHIEPERLGRPLGAGLYQDGTGDNAPIVHATGGARRWSRTPSALFGGRRVSPNYGWRWRRLGGVLVGTFGIVPAEQDTDRTYPASAGYTAGIDPRTGKTLWVTGGDTWCGRLSDHTATGHIRCRSTGSVTHHDNRRVTTRNLSTRIEAVDPGTGRARWSIAVDGFSALFDNTKPLVGLGNGRFATVLDDHRTLQADLRTGAVSAVRPDRAGWCTRTHKYTYHESWAEDGKRAAESHTTPCTLDGRPATTPAGHPAGSGATTGQVYAWADREGLHGITRTPGS